MNKILKETHLDNNLIYNFKKKKTSPSLVERRHTHPPDSVHFLKNVFKCQFAICTCLHPQTFCLYPSPPISIPRNNLDSTVDRCSFIFAAQTFWYEFPPLFVSFVLFSESVFQSRPICDNRILCFPTPSLGCAWRKGSPMLTSRVGWGDH